MFPSAKAVARARDKLRDLTGSHRGFVPVTDMIGSVNRRSRGWTRYFSHGYPRKAFRHLHGFILQRLTRHLQRRSQHPFRLPEGRTYYAHLHALGLQPLACPARD